MAISDSDESVKLDVSCFLVKAIEAYGRKK